MENLIITENLKITKLNMENKMLLIPAIDLKDGLCVRLKQGRMEDATIFSNNPLEIAQKWVDEGAKRLHLVDLNGAFAGSPQNAEVVKEIRSNFPNLILQIGGGIRDEETANFYWKLGVNFCIFGSKAAQNPEFINKLAKKYPKQIILGIDAKNGMVAINGWAEVLDIKAIDLINKFSAENIESIIYTDISKDGMMQGVSINQTEELAQHTQIPVIASGGISSLEDLRKLKNSSANIYGAILGKALYSGVFSLKEALEFYCK